MAERSSAFLRWHSPVLNYFWKLLTHLEYYALSPRFLHATYDPFFCPYLSLQALMISLSEELYRDCTFIVTAILISQKTVIILHLQHLSHTLFGTIIQRFFNTPNDAQRCSKDPVWRKRWRCSEVTEKCIRFVDKHNFLFNDFIQSS